jgi:glycosyltransferase involved in cell wall biosynthesis
MIEASVEKDRFKLFFTIPDAGRLLRAFDIFVLPSRKEGLPFVILESLLAGLPIIATDVGGVKEAVGDAGIIVPPDDSSALAQALAEAIENENLREQLAENSRLRAAEIIRQGELMIEKTWTAYGL